MTKVGALNATIGLNTAEFETSTRRVDASLDKSARHADQLGKKLDGMGGSVGRVTAMLGGLISAGTAFAAMRIGQRATEWAKDLQLAADQAGVTAERLQILRQSLARLDVSTTSSRDALSRLHAMLGEVQNGADNAATKALDRLGVRAKMLSGEISDTDQLLRALAESAKTAGTEAQFTSSMIAIFGRKVGVEMAAALRDGGAALAEMEAQLRANGRVVDQHLIDKLNRANETIADFSERASQHMAIFAGTSIGWLESVMHAIDRFNEKLRGAGVGFASRASQIADYERRNLGQLMQQQRWKVAEANGALNIARNERARTGEINGGRVLQAINDLRRETAELERLDGIRREMRADPWTGRPVASSPAPVLPSAPPAASGGGGGGHSATGRAVSSRPAPAVLTPADQRYEWMMRNHRVGPSFEYERQNPLADVRASMADLSEMLARMPIPDLSRILPVEDQDRLSRFADGFNRDLSAGLADAIMYGRNLGDALVDTFKRAAVAMIASGILNFLSGDKDGLSFGTMFKNLGSIFGGMKMAAGGPVRGPGTGTSDSVPAMLSNGEYVINARAAEAFRPFLDQINFNPRRLSIGNFAVGGPVGADMVAPRLPSFGAAEGLGGGDAGVTVQMGGITLIAPGADAGQLALLQQEMQRVERELPRRILDVVTDAKSRRAL